MSWTITKEDVRKISLGAQVLSCGGGGKTHTIEHLLLSVMNEDDVIIVKTINELMDEWVLPVAVVGSPVLFSEDLPVGTEFLSLVEQYERHTGKEVNAVISLEIGGMNAISPLIAALQTDLPVVDGDGTGRASPELDMTTLSLNKVPITPAIIKTQHKFSMVTDSNSEDDVKDHIKEFLSQDSGYVHFAGFGMSGNRAKVSMVPGTLQLAYKLGRILLEDAVSDKMELMSHEFGNSVYGGSEVVFHGVISSVKRWFENKSLVGVCEINGMYAYTNRQIVIRFQNEFVSIQEHGMICSTPDLILVMSSETLFPYNTTDIQEGDEVFVMAIPAPSILRTTEMLRRMGPSRFGLAHRYQSFRPKNGGIGQ